jgi:uncharacterized damage-inducible protein DinB
MSHYRISRHNLAVVFAVVFVLGPATAAAQNGPLQSNARMMYGVLKLWIGGAAEKMPEAEYAFRPTPDIRSYGQIIGHVVDMQYHFCSQVLGEKNPSPGIEKSVTAKADLQAALTTVFAYCDRAYAAVPDSTASELVTLDGRMFPRHAILDVNELHMSLHYGNLITYMRLKNIVPPSSDPSFMPPAPKK